MRLQYKLLLIVLYEFVLFYRRRIYSHQLYKRALAKSKETGRDLIVFKTDGKIYRNKSILQKDISPSKVDQDNKVVILDDNRFSVVPGSFCESPYKSLLERTNPNDVFCIERQFYSLSAYIMPFLVEGKIIFPRRIFVFLPPYNNFLFSFPNPLFHTYSLGILIAGMVTYRMRKQFAR